MAKVDNQLAALVQKDDGSICNTQGAYCTNTGFFCCGMEIGGAGGTQNLLGVLMTGNCAGTFDINMNGQSLLNVANDSFNPAWVDWSNLAADTIPSSGVDYSGGTAPTLAEVLESDATADRSINMGTFDITGISGLTSPNNVDLLYTASGTGSHCFSGGNLLIGGACIGGITSLQGAAGADVQINTACNFDVEVCANGNGILNVHRNINTQGNDIVSVGNVCATTYYGDGSNLTGVGGGGGLWTQCTGFACIGQPIFVCGNVEVCNASVLTTCLTGPNDTDLQIAGNGTGKVFMGSTLDVCGQNLSNINTLCNTSGNNLTICHTGGGDTIFTGMGIVNFSNASLDCVGVVQANIATCACLPICSGRHLDLHARKVGTAPGCIQMHGCQVNICSNTICLKDSGATLYGVCGIWNFSGNMGIQSSDCIELTAGGSGHVVSLSNILMSNQNVCNANIIQATCFKAGSGGIAPGVTGCFTFVCVCNGIVYSGG